MFKLVVVFAVLFSLVSRIFAYDSSYNQDKSLRYIQFAGAAYCADPIFVKNKIDNWSCQACKNFPHVNATVFHGSKSDGNGFVAYDADANEIVISFSGTDPLSIQNWIDDLNFFKTGYPYCDNKCQVHQGFLETFTSVKDQVYSLLKNYLSAHSTATIAITGHSLGAALAAHCAAELTHGGYKIKTVYTYGMPRVGDEAFYQYYYNNIIGTFRVVHDHDPVPHLPPESFGFHHMPYEVFYVRDYNQYTVCNSNGEDKNCSDKYLTDLNVLNHLNYMGFDMTANYLACQL